MPKPKLDYDVQRVRLNLSPDDAARLRLHARADGRTLAGFVMSLVDKHEKAK